MLRHFTVSLLLPPGRRFIPPRDWQTPSCVHTLVVPCVRLTAVQIKVISLCANHLILQIIRLVTDFLNALLNHNL